MKNKELRIKEAEERNKKWNKLTKEEKIRSLKSRRGESRKQLSKLEKDAEGKKSKK